MMTLQDLLGFAQAQWNRNRNPLRTLSDRVDNLRIKLIHLHSSGSPWACEPRSQCPSWRRGRRSSQRRIDRWRRPQVISKCERAKVWMLDRANRTMLPNDYAHGSPCWCHGSCHTRAFSWCRG